MTHSKILALYGDKAELARILLGDYTANYTKLSKWVQRNRIPEEYYPELVQLAVERDLPVTHRSLVEGDKGLVKA